MSKWVFLALNIIKFSLSLQGLGPWRLAWHLQCCCTTTFSLIFPTLKHLFPYPQFFSPKKLAEKKWIPSRIAQNPKGEWRTFALEHRKKSAIESRALSWTGLLWTGLVPTLNLKRYLREWTRRQKAKQISDYSTRSFELPLSLIFFASPSSLKKPLFLPQHPSLRINTNDGHYGCKRFGCFLYIRWHKIMGSTNYLELHDR